MTTIETLKTTADAAELDELLWRILWQPIGLPRSVRGKLNIEGKKFELVLKENRRIVGGLVAVWTADTEIELRHLAVDFDAQRKGIGRRLVNELSRIAALKKCHRLHTIARNTSIGFFRKIGFRTAPGQAPQHPVFVKQGITFKLMEKFV